MSAPPATRRCAVADESAVYAARALVRAFAREAGFEPEVVEELVVVVSELTSNIVKYGRRGSIELSSVVRDDGARGVAIVAEDETPPFDLDAGKRDGHDAAGPLDPARVFGRGGIGAGLGAVFRLSDAVELVPSGAGKQIVVRRFLGRPRRGAPTPR